MSVKMVEAPFQVPEPVRPAAVLQQNRVFLDFFWDLAKPDQEVRLKAVENLVEYLKSNNKVSWRCSLVFGPECEDYSTGVTPGSQ